MMALLSLGVDFWRTTPPSSFRGVLELLLLGKGDGGYSGFAPFLQRVARVFQRHRRGPWLRFQTFLDADLQRFWSSESQWVCIFITDQRGTSVSSCLMALWSGRGSNSNGVHIFLGGSCLVERRTIGFGEVSIFFPVVIVSVVGAHFVCISPSGLGLVYVLL